jgi:hypothetical protein
LPLKFDADLIMFSSMNIRTPIACRLGRKRIENELNAIERCDFKALALLLQSKAPTNDGSVTMAATSSEQDD